MTETHVQELMEEGGVDVLLNRWQCIFSLDTGMFYASFIIVSFFYFEQYSINDHTRLSGDLG